MKQCRLKIEKLKEYMANNNMSEKEFAEKIGISYPEFYRILKGMRNPGAKFIASLLDACRDLKYDDVFYSVEVLEDKTRRENGLNMNTDEFRKGFPIFLRYYQGIEGEVYNSEEEKPIKVCVYISNPGKYSKYPMEKVKNALINVFKKIIDDFS